MAEIDLRFLAAQNERILTRLGGVETRLSGLETRLSGLETKIDALSDDMRVLTAMVIRLDNDRVRMNNRIRALEEAAPRPSADA